MAQVAPAFGMGDAIQNSFSQIGNVIAQYAQNELAMAQAKKQMLKLIGLIGLMLLMCLNLIPLLVWMMVKVRS